MVFVVHLITKHPVIPDQRQFVVFICSEQEMQSEFMQMLSIQKPIVMVTNLKANYAFLLNKFFFSTEVEKKKTILIRMLRLFSGITYPSGEIQEALLTEFYDDLQMDPTSLTYVEAHSTGTVVGDPEECKALDNVFCRNRTIPLLVGSVKSNIGHTESTSGACSVAKVIITFQNGQIPPNIHFEQVRPSVPALTAKRMIVCDKITPFKGDKIAINSFGFGGANGNIEFSNVFSSKYFDKFRSNTLFFRNNFSSSTRFITNESKSKNKRRCTKRCHSPSCELGRSH